MAFVITIDGPAGSGKSTAARKLAGRLGIAYMDTGAMYRAVALAGMRQHIDWHDHAAVAQLLHQLNLLLDCGPTHVRVALDGHDVSEAVRSPEVTALASRVAQLPPVRDAMVAMQRHTAQRLFRVVTEGRDQGATVFPDAACKFVLTASLEKRAERRFHEMNADGAERSYDWVVDNLTSRDQCDTHRWQQLLAQPGVQVIDTTSLSMSEVIDQLEAAVRPCMELCDQPQLFA